MTKVNSNNGSETKSDIFSWDIFVWDIFICHKILKYFNEFYDWHLSISLQKCTQTKIKIKRGMCIFDSIFPYLQ